MIDANPMRRNARTKFISVPLKGWEVRHACRTDQHCQTLKRDVMPGVSDPRIHNFPQALRVDQRRNKPILASLEQLPENFEKGKQSIGEH
ncbi:hypothetical protein D3C73_1222240 [compost metagenome]